MAPSMIFIQRSTTACIIQIIFGSDILIYIRLPDSVFTPLSWWSVRSRQMMSYRSKGMKLSDEFIVYM